MCHQYQFDCTALSIAVWLSIIYYYKIYRRGHTVYFFFIFFWFGCMIVSPKFALSQGFASKCSQINLAPIVEIPFWSHRAVNPTEPPRCLNAVRRWSSFSISLSSKILKSAPCVNSAQPPLFICFFAWLNRWHLHSSKPAAFTRSLKSRSKELSLFSLA